MSMSNRPLRVVLAPSLRGGGGGAAACARVPRGEMQDILEGGDGVACSLAYLCLLDQGLVEQRHGVLGLLFGVASGLVAFGLLPRRGAWDGVANLGVMVLAGLRPLPFHAAVCAVGLAVFGGGQLERDLVPAGEDGIV